MMLVYEVKVVAILRDLRMLLVVEKRAGREGQFFCDEIISA